MLLHGFKLGQQSGVIRFAFEKVIVTYLEKTFEFPETKMATTLDLGRQSPGWVKHYEMSRHVTQPGL